MYRKGYPDRQKIVSQITELWERYGLETKTTFDTRVTKAYKDPHGRWVVNDPSYGRFDSVIAAIGTCGDPKMAHVPSQEKFKGEIYHSSQLDGKNAKDKNAVETLEFVAAENVVHTNVLARVPEGLRLFLYRDLYDLSPPPNSSKGIFIDTPMVNDDVLSLVRNGKASWLHSDIIAFDDTPTSGPGREELIEADFVIMTTGYHRPSLNFLLPECFAGS
ncbi:hypothetical protein V2W45_1467148 [Cenococcum geophilum]